MQTPRDPSMEDILASIKRVIAEEKELRAAVPPSLPASFDEDEDEEDILELDHPVVTEPPVDTGPPSSPRSSASAWPMALSNWKPAT